MTPDDGPNLPRWLAWGLRIAIVVGVAYAAHALFSYSMTLADTLPEDSQNTMRITVILTALLVYALLIAIPFVPGVEIGFALLLMNGATIAPAVYLSTVAGLLLAYGLGRLVPQVALERMFRDLRLTRAANLLARTRTQSRAEREALLDARLPPWLALPIIRFRYLSLGLLLNMPGNVILGGGGGLMLAAGISRLFTGRAIALTIVLAVLPVPLMIWWFGIGFIE